MSDISTLIASQTAKQLEKDMSESGSDAFTFKDIREAQSKVFYFGEVTTEVFGDPKAFERPEK